LSKINSSNTEEEFTRYKTFQFFSLLIQDQINFISQIILNSSLYSQKNMPRSSSNSQNKENLPTYLKSKRNWKWWYFGVWNPNKWEIKLPLIFTRIVLNILKVDPISSNRLLLNRLASILSYLLINNLRKNKLLIMTKKWLLIISKVKYCPRLKKWRNNCLNEMKWKWVNEWN